MRAYSLDLRQRIISAVKQGQAINDVADTFKVHPKTITRYLKLDVQGDLIPKRSTGRPPKLTPEQQDAFKEQLLDHPSLTYAERAELFEKEHGVHLSNATISRLVRRLRYSRKKSPSAR